MSMIVREIGSVVISGREAGDEFADAAADTQADFFRGMMNAIKHWNGRQCWTMQCVGIAKEMSRIEREELAGRLTQLVEYLSPRVAPSEADAAGAE